MVTFGFIYSRAVGSTHDLQWSRLPDDLREKHVKKQVVTFTGSTSISTFHCLSRTKCVDGPLPLVFKTDNIHISGIMYIYNFRLLVIFKSSSVSVVLSNHSGDNQEVKKRRQSRRNGRAKTLSCVNIGSFVGAKSLQSHKKNKLSCRRARCPLRNRNRNLSRGKSVHLGSLVL